MADLRELMHQADRIKPFAVVSGVPYYTYSDYQTLSELEMRLSQADPNEVDLIPVSKQADGMGYNNTNVKRMAGDPEAFFANRYRKTDTGYELSIDKRAIREQSKGAIYLSTLVVYQFSVTAGKIVLEGTTKVTAKEFVDSFTSEFDHQTMLKILETLDKNREKTYAGAKDSLDLK